jgi:hypothetical protein
MSDEYLRSRIMAKLIAGPAGACLIIIIPEFHAVRRDPEKEAIAAFNALLLTLAWYVTR